MSPQYHRDSSNSGSSARLPTRSRGHPFSKSNGSQRVQGPQYSQPRHTTTLQEFHHASAQSMDNESPTQGDFYLSSMDHDSHYGQQPAHWNESHSVYVSQDVLPTYQSTGRSRQNITSTESITPNSQFYSSEPSAHVAPTHGRVNASTGPHFSGSQVLPSTMVEVPMALSAAPTFRMDPSYSMDGYSSYSQATTQGNTLSFLSTQDLDNDTSAPSGQWNGAGLYSPEAFCAIIEDSSAGYNGTLPLSPPLSLSDSDSPPNYASLPVAMMDVSGPSYGFQDEYIQGAPHIYSQDMCDNNYPPPPPYVEEPLNERTIRASRPQPRPLLSAALVKGPSREDDDSPPSSGSNSPGEFTKEYLEAKSNDDRSHPHYKAKPGPDGNYHCPYASQKDCEHRPTPQKCQYDKYLDSHLKPYRCKAKNAPQCADARFSSTACRLRHEREAHGLHGHGKMPHLCEYPACDRAQHDNGFPRRWNLYDHMKRVHAWTAPEDEADDEGPEAPPAPPGPPGPPSCTQRVEKKIVPEKRKKVTKSGSVPMKKSRSGMASRDHHAVVKSRSQVQQEQELRTISQNFDNCKTRIQAQLHDNIQLGDELGFERLGAMQQELLTIQLQYRRLTAGQVADEVTGYA